MVEKNILEKIDNFTVKSEIATFRHGLKSYTISITDEELNACKKIFETKILKALERSEIVKVNNGLNNYEE